MIMEWNHEQGVIVTDSGVRHDPMKVADRLPWRQQGGKDRPAEFDPLIHMPLHEFVVRGDCDPTDWELLSFVVSKHPGSFRAFFRGYQYPMRYLELGDRRYWATAPYGVQMLNRCLLDSVEPPRRVDQGAQPICWQEWRADEPYLPQGSGWSDEYRAENPDHFDPERTPPCAHGVIREADRVKHLATRRYGTVVSAVESSDRVQVVWDSGKTSWVGRKGLRTQCCLPTEPLGPAPDLTEKPAARAAPGGGSSRDGRRAVDLHYEFWSQLTAHLDTRGSPVQLGKPTRTSMASVPRGPHKFRLICWNLLRDRTSGVWVRWDGPGAQAVVERLQSRYRESLTEKLSHLGDVVWLSPEDRGSVLSLRRSSDLGDRQSWPGLVEWFTKALETLRSLLEGVDVG